MRKIAVMPGRFHPFHRGHLAGYQELVDNFGKNNVFIATSAISGDPKHPFSLEDKKRMMTALGIPANHILTVTNPYSGNEYAQQFENIGIDPEQTILVFGLSGKDINEKPGMFTGGNKRDGTPKYIQPYTNGELTPMTNNAWAYITNVEQFPIAGRTVDSASQLRAMYASGNDKLQKQILADLYGPAGTKLKSTFDHALNLQESLRRLVRSIRPRLAEANVQQKIRILKLLKESYNKFHTSKPELPLLLVEDEQNLDYLDE